MRSGLDYFATWLVVLCAGCSAFGGQSGTESTDLEGHHTKVADEGRQTEDDAGSNTMESLGATGEDGLAGRLDATSAEQHFDTETAPTVASTASEQPTLLEIMAQLPSGARWKPATLGECTPPVRQEYETGCQIEQRCENDEFVAQCIFGETTDCSCGGYTGLHRFSLPSSVADACGDIIDPCKDETITYGEAACTATELRVLDGSCSAERQCEVAVSVGSLDAVSYDTQRSSCTRSTEGGLDCSCTAGDKEAWYHLATSELAAGCENTLELCPKGPAPATFSRTSTCENVEEARGEGSCALHTACLYESEIDGDVTRIASGRHAIICDSVGSNGNWGCDCVGPNNDVDIELLANPLGSDVCADLNETCKQVREEVVFRDGSCRESSRGTVDDLCYVAYDCELPTRLGDLDTVLHKEWRVRCEEGDLELGWKCGCYGTEYQALSVRAGTLADACSAAVAPCADLVLEWASSE